ncbi:MAG: DEDD exonuclease domain-containing protein [Acidimicrobiia bacterium]
MSGALQRSFDDLGTPLFDVTFCVVDLETTGGSPRDCGITEIGAVKVRGGEVVGSFQTLVNPGDAIPAFITVLTGITQSMVVEAPPVEAVIPSFLEFCGDAVIVGHNVRFDLSFLNAAADRLGYGTLTNRWGDTAALARRLVRSEVRNLKLGTLAAYFRSPVTPNHRALEDARATMHVLHSLLERAGGVGVTALEDLLVLPTAKGSADYRKIDLARGLPRQPGVYLFADRDGTVFYVGKATNLRTRVTSYFHGDERRSVTTMLRELEAIDHIVCPTELEASITELRLIHSHRPRHNRAGRPSRSTHWVTLTDGAFPRLSITRTLHSGSRMVLGPFRSHQSAEAVMVALWDALPIRRCTGRPGSRQSPCAPAQLGVALCPCDGNLSSDDYREVVDLLVTAVRDNPALVLGPLEDRMRDHARQQRFEEAGWLRDRHRALARAIERRRRWQALTAAGRLIVERSGGETAVIDQGRYVAGWATGAQHPFLPEPQFEDHGAVPPSSAVAAEADIIWKWISQPDARIIDATGGLGLPAKPVTELARTG